MARFSVVLLTALAFICSPVLVSAQDASSGEDSNRETRVDKPGGTSSDQNQNQEQEEEEDEDGTDDFIPGTGDDEEEEDESEQDEQQEESQEEEQEREDPQEGEGEDAPQEGDDQEQEGVEFDWTYSGSATVKYQEVHGAENQSTLDENFTAYANHDLNLSWIFSEDREFSIETSVRTSDDPRADADPFTINRFQTQYETAPHTFTAGDYAASFSDYSLSRALKGVAYEYEQENQRLRVMGGTDKPEWEMAWERTRGEPRDRLFQGVRYERDYFDSDLETGVSLAHARDNFEGTNEPGPGEENWNTGIDANWDINDTWRASGEVAWSTFDENINASGQEHSDWAGQVRLNYNKEDFRADASYEAVGREFQTASGSGTPGTRRFLSNASWDAMDILTVDGGFTYIDNARAGTSRSEEVNGGFRLHDIDYFPGWRLDERLILRADHPGQSNNTSRTITNSLTMSNTFMGVRGSFSYDVTSTEVHPQGNQGSRTDSFRVNTGAPLDFLISDARVGMTLSHQITENRSTGGDDTSNRLSTNIQIPLRERTDMNIHYSLSDRESAQGQDSQTNQYGVDVEYRFPDPTQAFVSLNIDHRDNDFGGSGNDYGETTVGLNANVLLP